MACPCNMIHCELCGNQVEATKPMVKENKELHRKLRIAREALEFYAELEAKESEIWMGEARAALEEIRGE